MKKQHMKLAQRVVRRKRKGSTVREPKTGIIKWTCSGCYDVQYDCKLWPSPTLIEGDVHIGCGGKWGKVMI